LLSIFIKSKINVSILKEVGFIIYYFVCNNKILITEYIIVCSVILLKLCICHNFIKIVYTLIFKVAMTSIVFLFLNFFSVLFFELQKVHASAVYCSCCMKYKPFIVNPSCNAALLHKCVNNYKCCWLSISQQVSLPFRCCHTVSGTLLRKIVKKLLYKLWAKFLFYNIELWFLINWFHRIHLAVGYIYSITDIVIYC